MLYQRILANISLSWFTTRSTRGIGPNITLILVVWVYFWKVNKFRVFQCQTLQWNFFWKTLKWPCKDVSGCSCIYHCADTRGSPCQSAKWGHYSRRRRWVRSSFLSVFRQVPRQSRTFAGVLMFMAIVTPNCSKNQRTFLNLAFSCFDYCSSRCTRDLLNKIPFKIWKIPTGRATNFKLNVTIKHCQKILPPCTLAPV